MSRLPPTLCPVLPVTGQSPWWPVHDSAGTRALETAALAAHPPHTLMARAGLAVARLALAAWPTARRVLALAGPGNNGGDALVAAAHLHQQGWAVQVLLLADPSRLPPDASWALDHAQLAGVQVVSQLEQAAPADLVIDGLLGLGARRAPEGVLAEAIAWLNASRLPVLAVDLPSGLDGDRGISLGTAAVRATHTLALLTLKPGLFTAQGRDHAGRVWLDTLGQPAPREGSLSLIGTPAAVAAAHDSHKGRFGDLLVVGGAPGMAGAAALAARAGLAAGAGRVYLGLLDPGAASDPTRPELMARPVDELLQTAWLQERTLVMGCGGGEAVRARLPAALAHAARLLLDADALNAIAADPGLRQALAARGRQDQPTVLTPHPLEAARLLQRPVAAVQADRLAAARQLATDLCSVVVLKGSGTVIAQPDGRCALNATGNARLATAGTGDVLAGWIGGLWARHQSNAFDAAAAAVWRHGLAAELARGDAAGPLPAADLVAAMQRA